MSDQQELQEYLEDQCIVLSVDELEDEGITTVDDFQDYFIGCYPSVEEFCEELFYELYHDEGSTPQWVLNHISWKDVWDCELRHDHRQIGDYFFTI